MGEILRVNSIINDAIQNGYKYIENNQLRLGIKYLEFAYNTKVIKDEYLLYALITSYYNLGEYEKTKQYIEQVKIDDIENSAIKEVILQILGEIEKFDEELQGKVDTLTSLELDDIKKDTLNKIADYKGIKKIIDDSELLEKHIALDQKIRNLRSFLIISKKQLKSIQLKGSEHILKFLLEYDLEDLLMKDENTINQTLNLIETNEFFIPEIDNYLELAKLFKDFFDEYKVQRNFLEAHKIYSIASEYDDTSIFVYQGILTNVFKEILSNKKLSKEFKNDITYDLIVCLKKGLITDDVLERVGVNIDVFDIEKFYIKILNAQKYLEDLSTDNVRFLSDANFLIRKYLKRNLDTFEKIKEKELVNKVLIYLYYSNYELESSLSDKIGKLIDLTDEKNEEIYEEIDKITLI